MGPFLAAAIPGVISSAGQLFANERRIAQADKQMRFQERMAGTEYQRAVADMRKAGLNPALAYQQGGASSPVGAMAGIEDPATSGVSSALQARRLKTQLEVMEATAKRTDAEFHRTQGQSVLQEQQYDWTEKFNRLDLAERKAMSKMWEEIGKSGKAAQFVLPFLKMLFGNLRR